MREWAGHRRSWQKRDRNNVNRVLTYEILFQVKSIENAGTKRKIKTGSHRFLLGVE